MRASEYDDDAVIASDEEGISDDSDDLMAQAQNGAFGGDTDDLSGSEDEDEGEGAEDEDLGSEEDDQQEEEEEQQHARQAEPHDKPQSKSWKPLTLEEQDMLLTAQNTSDTAVMQLQVAELLRETRAQLSAEETQCMLNDLERLRKALSAASPGKVSGQAAAGFIRDLGLDPEAVTLDFQPPTAVTAVGSLALGACMARSQDAQGSHLPTLDVAVSMPSACFFKKAHLNYRYHALRALYLLAMAKHLAASPVFKSRKVHLEAHQSDPTRPVLVMAGQPAGTATTPAYQLRLLPCISPDAFPLPRLAPDRNGVRWVQRPSAGAAATAEPASRTPGATARGKAAKAGAAAVAGMANSAGVEQAVKGPGGGVSTSHLAPTPCYNAGIAADMVVLAHAALLQRTSASIPTFNDGLVLLKVWAHQHQLAVSSGSADGLDGHSLAMLLVHLAERGKLTHSMTPLQVLRAGLHALTNTDPVANLAKGCGMTRLTPDLLTAAVKAGAAHLLHPDAAHAVDRRFHAPKHQHPPHDLDPVVAAALGATSTPTPLLSTPAPSVQAYHKASPAALVDPTGWCNTTAHMSKAAVTAVTTAAKASVDALNAPADGEAALASVVLSPARVSTAYDYLWVVDVPPAATYTATLTVPSPAQPHPPAVAVVAGEDTQGIEHWEGSRVGDSCVARVQEAAVESVVKAALTDRAHLVRAVRRPVAAAAVSALSEGLLTVNQPHEVLVGAKLDPSLSLRLVDIGPPADDTKAAAKFRAFWGPVAELRRFQDGKINEAVVWGAPNATPGSRHGAPDRAVAYAVERHRPGGALGTLRSSGMLLDGALRGEDNDPSTLDEAVMAGRLLEAATDKLSKQLRALKGLALEVVAVQALSAAARHTEVFTPMPHPLAGGVPANQVARALSTGGRVPRVLEPQELLVQLENSGRWPAQPAAFNKMKAALGVQLAQTLESTLGLTAQATEDYVDVMTDGFAFRLILYSGRDETMLLEQAQGQHAVPRNTTPASPETKPVIRSWHHGLISRVGGVNPVFGPACRLAKRWVAAHAMSNHVAEEAVELLVAAVFTAKGPRGIPGSRVSGFLRFLELLSQHPWSSRPLVIDPDHSLTASDYKSILSQFSDRRAQGGAMPALYLVTPRDRTSRHWTLEKPTPAALGHLAARARSCLAAAALLIESGDTTPLPPSAAAATDNETSEGHQQAALDEAVLGALFTPQPEQFDMVLTLRDEALPLASQALPTWLVSGQGKRHRQPDLLSQYLEYTDQEAPLKRARVFLDSFPDKAIATRKPAALRQELLVGFDPLEILLSKVQEHVTGGANHPNRTQQPDEAPKSQALPLLATLCADSFGGRAVGVKWAPTAFLPAAAKATSCQFSLPCLATHLSAPDGAAVGSKKAPPKAAQEVGCVPDVTRILSEICEIGQGMVAGVTVHRSCSKLPAGPP